MIIFVFCIYLIVVGLVLGFRKEPKLVRVGKSIECFAFLLINLRIFYNDAFFRLYSSENTSVVWMWLPLIISFGVLSICLLIIWKPLNDKKLRNTVFCITSAMLILIVVASLAGTYNESFIEDLASFVFWPAHLVLSIVALFVYFCFSKKQVAARIGLSVLCLIPFIYIWFLVWVFVSDEWYMTGQPLDTSFIPILAFLSVGSYLICLLFILKLFRTKVRLIAAMCIAGATALSVGGVIGFRIYDDSLTFYSAADEVESFGRDISLIEYEPFRENTLAESLGEPSSLRLHDNLPRLEGATALYPLYAAFARAVYPEANYPVYSSDNPSAYNDNHIVTCSMTSGAFERLIDGKADVIFLMGVSNEQREMARERGLELSLTPIGREAFVFFVNKRNYISNLTVDDVRGIYSGQITNWREVGGNNDAIRPYQRAENSGSQTMLMEIMGDTPLMAAPEADYYDMMYEIYRAVAVFKNYRNSLGYSFLYYINNMIAENRIKFLSIDGVEPTATNIANGTYPFANDFYAITIIREPEDEIDAERINNTEMLIEWILSPQGQSLVEKTGYVPISK